MKKTMARGAGRWMWRIAAGVILLAAHLAAQDPSPDAIRRLETELRAVRTELLECRLEIQAGKVAWLERELAQAADERQRLEHSERLLLLEIRQVDQRLSDADLGAEERAELESERTETLGTRIRQARAALDSAGRRQSAIGSQLEAEKIQLHSLRQRAEALAKPQSPQP